MIDRARQEERCRDAQAATARQLREAAARNGHTLTVRETEERVRKAVTREQRRNPDQ